MCFRQAVVVLIESRSIGIYLIIVVAHAEFYREIGEFEVAHDILESVEVEDEFLKRIMTQIQERVQNNDCRVFKIQ